MARIEGRGGDLRVGYQVAGTIGSWVVTTTPTAEGIEIAIEIEPVALDPYWSTQRPITVTLDWFGRCRVWRDVTPIVTAETWHFPSVGIPEVL